MPRRATIEKAAFAGTRLASKSTVAQAIKNSPTNEHTLAHLLHHMSLVVPGQGSVQQGGKQSCLAEALPASMVRGVDSEIRQAG